MIFLSLTIRAITYIRQWTTQEIYTEIIEKQSDKKRTEFFNSDFLTLIENLLCCTTVKPQGNKANII